MRDIAEREPGQRVEHVEPAHELDLVPRDRDRPPGPDVGGEPLEVAGIAS